MLKQSGGSLADCIMDVYPDIGLEKHRFNAKACTI